jgi:ASCH domain
MKALSVREPWASLIASGKKTIETRSWRTNYRGEILICGSARPEGPSAGMAVCTARIVACCPMTEQDERHACCDIYRGAWSWFLADIRPLKRPFGVKGRLGFYDVVMPK